MQDPSHKVLQSPALTPGVPWGCSQRPAGHPAPSSGTQESQWGLQPSPRQLCNHSHESQSCHSFPWSCAGPQHPSLSPPGAKQHLGVTWAPGRFSKRLLQHKLFIKKGVKWVNVEQGQGAVLDPRLCGLTRRIFLKGTWPYFERLQKDLHIKLLDGSSLPHLNCSCFFINQLLKET